MSTGGVVLEAIGRSGAAAGEAEAVAAVEDWGPIFR